MSNPVSDLERSSMFIHKMTFEEVAARKAQCPSIILPLSGLEPYGNRATLGINSICAQGIAEALSSSLEVMVAPILEYGYTTAFKAFEGSAGGRNTTVSNLVLQLCNDWLFQGFKSVLVINTVLDNEEPLEVALQRLNAEQESVKVLSLHTDLRIGAFLNRENCRNSTGRQEKMMLSIAEYLSPQSFREENGAFVQKRYPDAIQYRTWRKRGKDPQTFRKLYPLGSTSEGIGNGDADLGCKLFRYILTLLEQEYSSFLTHK